MQVATKDLQRYPHMFPRDIAIWERFLKDFGESYSHFNYDVKVGSGTSDILGRNDAYSKMQRILSLYRIDAVGFRGSDIDIIEVKPRATTAAIGQVIVYKELYERDFQPTQTVIPTIVTDYEMPDIRYLTKELGIQYIVMQSTAQVE